MSTVIRPTEISPKARKSSSSVEIDNVMEVDNQPEEDSDDTDGNDEKEDDYVAHNTKSKVSLSLSQLELNDFIRDLGLPKDGAEYSASFLKKRNFLEPNTKVSFYRNRDREFRKFFTKDKETSGLLH